MRGGGGTISIPGFHLFCPSPCMSNKNFNQEHVASPNRRQHFASAAASQY